MKKKISIFVAGAMLLMQISTYAQGVCLLTKEEERLTYKGDAKSVYVLSAYKDGLLEKSYVMQNDNGLYWAPDFGEEYELRICDILNDKTYSADIQVPTPTPPKEEETKGEQEYNPNIYPEGTYDRAIDAYYAFSVIDKVATLSKDNEICYEVTYANKGEKKTEIISEDALIVTSSSFASGLVGGSAASLKQGDVVFFDRRLNGEITQIGLIMRPSGRNYLTDQNSYGTNFESLISQDGAVCGIKSWTVAPYGDKIKSGKGVTQYAFGMSAYKDGKLLYLLNKECNLDTALEIELKDKTAVYVCDKSSLVGGIEVGSISAIGSNISKKQFLKGGTVSPEEEGLSYVLVRTVDGVATDIVYYQY